MIRLCTRPERRCVPLPQYLVSEFIIHIHACADKPRSFRFASLLLLFFSLSHGLYIVASSENILNQDLHIQSAVMFGRGRFYPGVVVDPKPEFRFDPVDERALTEFRNLIW